MCIEILIEPLHKTDCIPISLTIDTEFCIGVPSFLNVFTVFFFFFQPKNCPGDQRMGCLPCSSTRSRRWLHGKPKMHGDHCQSSQSCGLPLHLHHGPWIRCHRQVSCLIHDVTDQEGQSG